MAAWRRRALPLLQHADEARAVDVIRRLPDRVITNTWTLWGPGLPAAVRSPVDRELRRRHLAVAP